ncbi:MAG: M24 family metallopeptidase [Gemmatimonadota bacterium]|nr:aminopeptidase P family protein [Gemmatimonadota bacterium]
MSDGLLLERDGVEAVQDALRALGLDGWLLYEFRQSNPVSASLLALPWTTRRGFALIPAEGEPVALVHAIEKVQWKRWPWASVHYSGWRELEAGLASLLRGRGRVAMETSPRSAVPTLDRVPVGIHQLVQETGVEIVGSGDLVSAFHARWSAAQLVEHRRAAVVLQRTAREAFERAREAAADDRPLTEGALAAWIRSTLADRGVGTDVGCIVAIGPRASDPHYDPGETGASIERGEALLIDLWGRTSEAAVPADQTWMGFLGSELPPRVAEVWAAVRDARDAVLDFLRARWDARETVRGFEADDVARTLLTERGWGEWFVHRTGHSIDRDLHGSGPNLDNLETRDDRALLVGVGFSVEPGVYLPGELGVRSEVDVHWGEDGPEVTTPDPQHDVFLLP